jgi:cell division GTPase FtsZ
MSKRAVGLSEGRSQPRGIESLSTTKGGKGFLELSIEAVQEGRWGVVVVTAGEGGGEKDGGRDAAD